MSAGGLFVTLEGPDGAGKSVQARLLAERIRHTGRDVLLTREPGGTELGEQVRQILNHTTLTHHDPLTDALLFSAARHQHVQEVIRPALAAGRVVVCDRFADSTVVYQGYGGGAQIDAVKTLTQIATGGLQPARTVLVDIPPELGLARRRAGDSEQMTRFEAEPAFDLDFHERVRAGFLGLATAEPERWRVVDGSADVQAVAGAIWAAVEDLFG